MASGRSPQRCDANEDGLESSGSRANRDPISGCTSIVDARSEQVPRITISPDEVVSGKVYLLGVDAVFLENHWRHRG